MKRSLVVIAAVVSVSRVVFAQSEIAAAEVLYNEAMTARAKKDFAAACPKFTESYRLDRSTAPTLVMVGECEEREGKLADAWGHLQEAMPKLRDAAQFAYAKRLSDSLEKRVPRLAVKLAPGAPDGTSVTRDGVELRAGSLGAALPVNPGERTIVVTAPGRKDFIRKVIVAEGKTAEIEVTPGDAGDAPAPTAETTAVRRDAPVARSDGGNRTLGYVLGGVGVVGLGVAGVTAVMLSSKRSEMNSANCNTSARTCAGATANNGVSAASSGAPLVPVFYGALGVGLVGVAAGAYFVLTSSSDGSTAVRLGPRSAYVEGRFLCTCGGGSR